LSPYVLMLLPSLFWAGNAVIARAVAGDMPPLALSFWRWMLAFLILAPFGLPRVRWDVVRTRWRVLALLALTSVTAYNTLLYFAVQTTTAINATLVGCTMPIIIVGLSWVWLGERLGAQKLAGVVISLIGVLVVIAHGNLGMLVTMDLGRGDLIMMIATVSWAVYSILLRKYPIAMDPIGVLTVLVGIGLLFMVPLYVADLAMGHRFALSSGNVAAIAYVAVFPSVLAYYFWNKGVAALGPSIAGQYTYAVPPFAAVLAMLFLGEAFRWYHGLGMGLIFFGIWLTTATLPATRKA